MKQCHFCTNNIKEIDYKDIEALKPFVNVHGGLTKARRHNLCSGHQRELARAVKRARYLALLPFITG